MSNAAMTRPQLPPLQREPTSHAPGPRAKGQVKVLGEEALRLQLQPLLPRQDVVNIKDPLLVVGGRRAQGRLTQRHAGCRRGTAKAVPTRR